MAFLDFETFCIFRHRELLVFRDMVYLHPTDGWVSRVVQHRCRPAAKPLYQSILRIKSDSRLKTLQSWLQTASLLDVLLDDRKSFPGTGRPGPSCRLAKGVPRRPHVRESRGEIPPSVNADFSQQQRSLPILNCAVDRSFYT